MRVVHQPPIEHRCDLRQAPEGAQTGTVIQCEECGQTWLKHVRRGWIREPEGARRDRERGRNTPPPSVPPMTSLPPAASDTPQAQADPDAGKSLGQIGRAAYVGRDEWDGLPPGHQAHWDRTAATVAARVRQECNAQTGGAETEARGDGMKCICGEGPLPSTTPGVDSWTPPPGTPECGYEDRCGCGEGNTYCTHLAMFTIERSDHHPAYDKAEACDKHLPLMIADLAEGDDVPIIVTVRWSNEPEATS